MIVKRSAAVINRDIKAHNNALANCQIGILGVSFFIYVRGMNAAET